MTGYLLDTHTLIWLAVEPRRLPAELLQELRESSLGLFASPISAMEIATKHRIGKLPGYEALVQGYAAHVRMLGTTPLPLTDQHALLAGSLEWEHRDPFDRLLAGQAICEGLALVSADRMFQSLAALRLITF